MFVLTKIDEILMWEQRKESERDTRFVELGRYLCEVRAGQYWRVENLKSFDEFLEKRFPESRRKAYYLMSIHEHLPPQVRKELKEVGWTKGLELAKLARRDGQEFDCATWLHKARVMPKDEFRREVEKELRAQIGRAAEGGFPLRPLRQLRAKHAGVHADMNRHLKQEFRRDRDGQKLAEFIGRDTCDGESPVDQE